MVRRQIESRGVTDESVLAAMRVVPRHEFVPPGLGDQAYEDHAVPLADGQTVSQPYIVALMTQMAAIPAGAKVLEIGTGSGYQAAVLAEIAADVYTVEVRAAIQAAAQARLERLHYKNVHCRCGDGGLGWPEAAPFDAILVTAAPSQKIPPALVEQLAEGARLVAPVGEGEQVLVVLERRDGRIVRKEGAAVRFVPLVEGESRAP
jgi:protein-L-isoaspartate(D-aspartate) O-methyltransferase